MVGSADRLLVVELRPVSINRAVFSATRRIISRTSKDERVNDTAAMIAYYTYESVICRVHVDSRTPVQRVQLAATLTAYTMSHWQVLSQN